MVGPTGATGSAGSIGFLGIAGRQERLAYLAGRLFLFYFNEYNCANALIPINSGCSFGSDVSLTNATTVTLSTPGIYLVSYYFQGDPTAGNETISVRLTLNGIQVAGSFIFMLQEVLLY